MRKIVISVLTLILLAMNIAPIQAQTKSVKRIEDSKLIDNADKSIAIEYGPEKTPARVFYGSQGISIIQKENVIRLETSFGVLRLVAINDINNDGYTDFFTYQKASESADQLFTVSGKDGKVLASTRLTRIGMDESLGAIEVNTTVLYMEAYKDSVIIICDYNIIQINPNDGNIINKYVGKDNIWDFVIYQDSIMFVDQLGGIGTLNVDSFELTMYQQISNHYELSLDYDSTRTMNAVMNLWDIEVINNEIFVTSEDGYLYKVNPSDFTYESKYISSIDLEYFCSIMSSHYNWNYDGLVYTQTGIMSQNFKAYKIIDSYQEYLLISCYMFDKDNGVTDAYAEFTPSYLVYNTKTNEVIYNIEYVAYSSQAAATFSMYNDQLVVASVYQVEEKIMKFKIFDLQGKIVLQKDFENGFIVKNNLCLTREDDRLLLEVFESGSCYISNDLSQLEYIFESVSAEFLSYENNQFIVLYKYNNVGKEIVSYQQDLTTVNWSYEVNLTTKNKGIEQTILSDYNQDGVIDVLTIVNNYNSKDEATASNFIFISGSDGKELVNKKISLGRQYDDKGKPYIAYLVASSLSTIKDCDNDGKKEIVTNGYVVSSKTFKPKGYIDNYLSMDGSQLIVGDCNGDSVEDIVVVSDSKATLFLSRISGLNVSYKKSSTTLSLDKALSNSTIATVIGDINNDGVAEIIFSEFNEKNYQTYIVCDGKTLKKMYNLCPAGVSEQEGFRVLDYDINNDGFNEVLGFTASVWANYLINGKDGSILTYINQNEEKNEVYDKGEFYHPSMLVKPDEDMVIPNVVIMADYNKDGNREFGVLKNYFNQTTRISECALFIYDGLTQEVMDKISLAINNYEVPDRFIAVENSGDYYVMQYYDKIKLIDVNKKEIISTFTKTGEKYLLVGSSVVLTGGEEKLVSLNIEKSFTMNSEIPETSNNHIIKLAWTPLIDYSVMKIYDNNKLVYFGSDTEYELPLLQGKHTITLSLEDGEGKSSIQNYNITITKQPNHYIWVTAVAVILIAVATFINMYRKAYIRKLAKGAK